MILFTYSLFAADRTELYLSHPESKTEMQSIIRSSGTDKHVVINSVINYLKALKSGARNGKFDLQIGGGSGVNSVGNVSWVGVPLATETVVVAGTTFTVVNEGSTTVPAVSFEAGTSAATVAANLAAVVNANTTTAALVTASSSAGSTIITAFDVGVIGDNITLAEGASSCTVSGANLAGGVDQVKNEYKFGY